MSPRRLLALAALLLGGACSHTTPFAVAPATAPFPPPHAVDHRLLLIGDAGDPDPDGEPTLEALRHQVELLPDRTTVVFLGDNVYETGMPDPSPIEGTAGEQILDEALLNMFESRRDAELRVKAQVRAVEVAGARAVFVPGNHDWDQFGTGGWKRVRELERYLGQLSEVVKVPIRMLPGGGCPGPVPVDLGRRARMLTLDTQWWLDAGPKPSPEDNPTGCAQTTEEAVGEALVAELEAAARSGRVAVVVGHHPLRTSGPHGGWVPAHTHVFPLTMLGSYVPFWVRWLPLPGLGSLGVWIRANRSPSVQDFSDPRNGHMRRALLDAMERAAAAGAEPLLYAAGHEHSLQVFHGDGDGPRYLLVSGLGSRSKASGVRHDGTSLFAHSDPAQPGFMKVDFLRDGRVRLAVVEWTAATPEGVEVYARLLAASGPAVRADAQPFSVSSRSGRTAGRHSAPRRSRPRRSSP